MLFLYSLLYGGAQNVYLYCFNTLTLCRQEDNNFSAVANIPVTPVQIVRFCRAKVGGWVRVG